MKLKCLLLAVYASLLAACAQDAPLKTSSKPLAHFSWFEYQGNDEIFKAPLAANQYQNPILAGYHPDPSIVRVGEDYYLVNSTFGFYPGIPVFHSRDLVNWTQLGNAIHRPEQLSFDGIHLGYNGVYAPAIEYRDGTFYVINTCVACGGNFIVTATNPAGPWSDPIWLPEVIGIDPSLFFDEDGKTYIVHHRNPPVQKYPAHTALWVMEVDSKTFAPVSDDVMLVDGGDEAPWHTEYIEGPHIYKIDGTYYLYAPGGGTGYFHGQLVYRSDNVFGPYEANPNNPVLAQVGLPDGREHPVTATGHADLFQDTNGDWWTVFLGTRVYYLDKPPQDPGNFATGRETFMLPVTWQNGWPHVLEKGEAVPYRVNKPKLPAGKPAPRAMTGNFTVREEFTNASLAPHWLFVRTPRSKWWQTGNGELILEARADTIGAVNQPSFIGRRLAHMTASFATQLTFNPHTVGDEAGVLAVQNDEHFYAFGLGLNHKGQTVLRVRKKAGKNESIRGDTVAEQVVKLKHGHPIYLRVNIDKAELNFAYSTNGKRYTTLLNQADASPLTTAKAGGFTGAVVGMYAESTAQQN
ncbi:glycoside hydrolase family 43 protein [Saccharophagus degradans]|uniref:Glycoside hydrolase family 43 protein n=1 Tax=Saccharophagus degradans TaxID=86304 RepID=A0AAW7X6P3_9GAMM|nr:glycoside hydrolase family 43 protein [Saccharophagus degradans]MDO6422172.1 glycoside hydrolase family 43 protein [Saccharophagus degradans]MDO6607553.1 glycoside hydrolase family 43 protein [Saccharophagus degradans]